MPDTPQSPDPHQGHRLEAGHPGAFHRSTQAQWKALVEALGLNANELHVDALHKLAEGTVQQEVAERIVNGIGTVRKDIATKVVPAINRFLAEASEDEPRNADAKGIAVADALLAILYTYLSDEDIHDLLRKHATGIQEARVKQAIEKLLDSDADRKEVMLAVEVLQRDPSLASDVGTDVDAAWKVIEQDLKKKGLRGDTLQATQQYLRGRLELTEQHRHDLSQLAEEAVPVSEETQAAGTDEAYQKEIFNEMKSKYRVDPANRSTFLTARLSDMQAAYAALRHLYGLPSGNTLRLPQTQDLRNILLTMHRVILDRMQMEAPLIADRQDIKRMAQKAGVSEDAWSRLSYRDRLHAVQQELLTMQPDAGVERMATAAAQRVAIQLTPAETAPREAAHDAHAEAGGERGAAGPGEAHSPGGDGGGDRNDTAGHAPTEGGGAGGAGHGGAHPAATRSHATTSTREWAWRNWKKAKKPMGVGAILGLGFLPNPALGSVVGAGIGFVYGQIFGGGQGGDAGGGGGGH